MTQDGGWGDLTAWTVAKLLLGWKVIIISCLSGLLLATVVAFTLDKQYEARTTLIFQAPRSKGLGVNSNDIGGLLGLASGSDAPPKLVTSVLSSNELAIYCINRLRLDTNWKLKKDTIFRWEDYCKSWNSHFGSAVDENGEIHVWYRDLSPALTEKVLTIAIQWVDSNYTRLKQQYAAKNSEYLLTLLEEHKAKLMEAEDSLLAFQNENKIIEPESEGLMAQKLSTAIQEQVISSQTQMELARITSGDASSQYQKLAMQVELLKKLATKKSEELFDEHKMGHDKQSPNRLYAWLTYERIKRNVAIQGAITQFLIQQFEQSQLEARKDISAFATLDPVRMPTKKVAPPRTAIMFLGLVIGTIMGVAFVVLEDNRKVFLIKLHSHIRMQ